MITIETLPNTCQAAPDKPNTTTTKTHDARLLALNYNGKIFIKEPWAYDVDVGDLSSHIMMLVIYHHI